MSLVVLRIVFSKNAAFNLGPALDGHLLGLK